MYVEGSKMAVINNYILLKQTKGINLSLSGFVFGFPSHFFWSKHLNLKKML